jgi:transcriptional regulator with XRE-family HTH domain
MAAKTLAERLREWRDREGLGYRKAAERTEISVPTLRAIEREGLIPQLVRVREQLRKVCGIATWEDPAETTAARQD